MPLPTKNSRRPNSASLPSGRPRQPLYRYEEPKGDLLDGALFTFVQGTDPQVLLLIEARRDDSGKASWQYALARLNGITLRAFYNDRKVWEAPELPWEVIHDRSQPYFKVQFR